MSKFVCALLSIYCSMFSQLQFPSVILLVCLFMNSSSLPDTWWITSFEISNHFLLVSGVLFCCCFVSVIIHILLKCTSLSPFFASECWYCLSVFLSSLYNTETEGNSPGEKRISFSCRGFFSETSEKMIGNVGEGAAGR